jgi:hypothetical protein
MGAGFRNQIESSFQFTDSFQPSVQDGVNLQGPLHGTIPYAGRADYCRQPGSRQILFQSSYNLHYLSEKYTEAAEAVKDFYSYYIIWCHLLRHAYMSNPTICGPRQQDCWYLPPRINSTRSFPPLEQMHIAFTESLDILYTLKAEITATLYGMIEEYSVLRAELQNRPVEILETDQPGSLVAASGDTGDSAGCNHNRMIRRQRWLHCATGLPKCLNRR